MPISCSMKKHTALARSAHEPPPKLTTPSTPSRRRLLHRSLHERHRHVGLHLGEGGRERPADRGPHPLPVVGVVPALRRDEHDPAQPERPQQARELLAATLGRR